MTTPQSPLAGDAQPNEKTPEGADSYSLRLNTLDYSTIFDTLKSHALSLVANAHSEMSEAQWGEYVDEITATHATSLHAALHAYILAQVLDIINEDFIVVTEYDKAINGVKAMQRQAAQDRFGPERS